MLRNGCINVVNLRIPVAKTVEKCYITSAENGKTFPEIQPKAVYDRKGVTFSMSYTTDRHSVTKLPSQSLAVVQCGLQICHSGHSSGWLTYPHYSAHFILEGKGTFTVNGKTYSLQAGEGFMITPNSSNIYIADKKDPWKYIYATFNGADDDAIVHNAGLDEEKVTFSFPLTEDMRHDLYAMLEASKNYDARGYDVIGYFLLAMSRLVRAHSAAGTAVYQPEHYLTRAMQYIEDHYPYNVTVTQIADYVGIDRTYLYRIFTTHLRQSPTRYLKRYRLEKAVEMMENQQLSISEIALSTGFYDVSHFYRAFTEQYGIPPKEYRFKKYHQED